MPNPDKWCREIDLLFVEGAADSRRHQVEEAGQSSVGDGDAAIDARDTARFGPPASSTSTAPEVAERFAEPDISARVGMEFDLPEDEVPTEPVPVILGEESGALSGNAPDGRLLEPEGFDQHDSSDTDRGAGSPNAADGPADPGDWIASFRDLDLDFTENGQGQGLAAPGITARAGTDRRAGSPNAADSPVDPGDWIASFRDFDLDFTENGQGQGLAAPGITARAGTDRRAGSPNAADGPADPSDWIASFRDQDLDFTENGQDQGVGAPAITARAGVARDLPEGEGPPASVRVTFDEDNPALVPLEPSDERDAPLATGNDGRRRRVWAVAGLAMAVAIGGILGAIALTWTDGPRRAANTRSEVTTTTTATTISPATTGSALDTSAPGTSVPSTSVPATSAPATSAPATSALPLPASPGQRPPSTTTPRSPGVPGAAPNEPSTPQPPPPPSPGPPTPQPPPPAPPAAPTPQPPPPPSPAPPPLTLPPLTLPPLLP